ncbi:alanine--tRNA ligase [Myceligenerans pegani]|uniref:Alanine--tRNA ligase n=1 Tax=Myceligenerans pegani TaxID=2776917 RepID=A0ABR9MV55_9MICO|nr:alanine--tRNA ligase [Myceligenerans sp. TRM 65318]MBE1875005.1 alanine--tRNA ligase [Myceligenerans sp. TRM 65318]MBE3017276.1 alanine--tRNA ligase [Myceligenerans sp. TRM 65318]
MRTAEIRKRWLDFFEARGHAVVPSASLISPDPSTLFTIAGMVPFIPYMTGQQTPPWKRATSVQKCVRTLDIDEVGKTTRHGTFFQMNGNFSFGDYFKEGAIRYAWEFLTGSREDGNLGIDPDLLWVTVYETDEEAVTLWKEVAGLPDERIQRMGKKTNYWHTGQPGPGGPCSEIFYDRGPEYGAEGGPAADEDRYIEIWNLVFMQYALDDVKAKDDFKVVGDLTAKNIDTGMGLERVAFLLQGVDNMYEIDEVRPVIDATEKLSGKRYGADHDDDVRMRVVADHVRSALMIIGDGVRPSNEGRGYVLRRLLRRSVRAMRLLGVEDVALPSLLPVSKDAMKASYPELETNFEQISQVAYAEEEAFRRTLAAGTTILDTAVSKLKAATPAGAGSLVLGGEAAFQLHDTYGFPIDLTLEMAAEQGVRVDEQAFRTLMQEQRDRARADALAKRHGNVDVAAYESVAQGLSEPVEFLGYTQHDATVRVVGLLSGGAAAPAATAPADVEVILDRTPFYAEAGGQLADQGRIVLDGGATIEVDDVQRPVKGLSVHRGRLVEGTVALGDPGTATIDAARRVAISKAHSATHMIHKALHELVGPDRTQAGSENAPSRIRFDFRSPQAVPATALGEIEERVNTLLTENLEVTDQQMPLSQAKALGAMALFGEKYGDVVRVVSIGGDWSRELCGGTHVKLTGELGRVTLLGESSIGSGVRRVDALVGDGAYGFQATEHALVGQLTGMLNVRHDELADRVGSLMTRLKDAEKELATLRQAQLLAIAGKLAAEAPRVGDVRVVTHDAGEAAADGLRALVLDVRARLGEAEPVVVAAGGTSEGRPVVVVATNEAARRAGHKAGDLVRAAARTLGGGGGGKPDLAQGGGQDPARLGEALAGVAEGVRLATVGA